MENSLILKTEKFDIVEKIITAFYTPIQGYCIENNEMAIYEKSNSSTIPTYLTPFPFNNTDPKSIANIIKMWIDSNLTKFPPHHNGDGSLKKGIELSTKFYIHDVQRFDYGKYQENKFKDFYNVQFLIRPAWIYYAK